MPKKRVKVKAVRAWAESFAQGYVCAVAEIIRTHDEPTIAKDVLRGIGTIDWSIIDEHDRETLEKAELIPAPRRKAKR